MSIQADRTSGNEARQRAVPDTCTFAEHNPRGRLLLWRDPRALLDRWLITIDPEHWTIGVGSGLDSYPALESCPIRAQVGPPRGVLPAQGVVARFPEKREVGQAIWPAGGFRTGRMLGPGSAPCGPCA